MKTRYTLIALFALVALMFHSCEDLITEVDIPASTEKLVVTSFISPDLPTITVRVFKSRPLYTTTVNTGGEYPPVANAVVKLSDGAAEVILPFNSETGSYQIRQSEMKIDKGKTYSLTVTEGEHTVTAACTVPMYTIPAIEVVKIDSTLEYGDIYYHADIRFRDSVGQGHYYHVAASYVYTGIESGSDPYVYSIPFASGDPYVSDKNKDGEYFLFKTEDFYNPKGDVLRLVLTLGVTDIHYYNYHKAVSNFEGENPFAEPTPIYSNMNGGLGVFAAYVQQFTVFEYK